MQFKSLSVLLAATAVTGMAVPAPSALAVPNGDSVSASEADFLPSTYFVQLKSPPAADGTSLTTLKAEKAAFRTAATKVGAKYTVKYSYDKLFNGLSINASRADINKIKSLANVTAVWPVALIEAPPKGSEPSPDLFTALAMTGADTAQTEMEYTGKGIKVAVMDTGIDIDHPAFGGFGTAGTNTFPTTRVAYGYDFVGDDFNADPASPSYNPIAVEDPNPDDCGGHGTHVAGIVGAHDTTNHMNHMKGVAPEVTFGAYRVFGCEGSTTADIMILAMERALSDGMDVLNMSIGSSFQWPQYPTAVAASRLVNNGMVVVASIGNSGTSGLYAAGAPGLGDKVIGTASFDNSHVFLPYFTSNGQNIGYITMTFSPNPPTSGTEEVVWVGRGCIDSDTTTPGNQTDPYLGDPSGKVALVQRGNCGFAEKATRAISAGATAVVVQNNAPGVFGGTLGAPLQDPRPVVGISLADGDFLRAQAAPVMMTWTSQTASFVSPTGGLISSFSSYGLSPDLALKPDIGAPGGNIYSSYPLELGGYATLSGTSMASPHVAGAAALLLEAKPKTPAQTVRGILQNSADPKPWWGAPTAPYLDKVHRQGAGMLDIDDAIRASTRIEPSKLSLGESQSGPATRTLTIRNGGPSSVTYDLSFANAISTNANTFAPGFNLSNASVSFGTSSVTVPPGGTATVAATITPATGPTKGQYGGYIVFTPQGGGQVYRVPFAGFVGDYQSIQALNAGPVPSVPMPWLAVLSNGSYYKLADPTDWTFTMQDTDVPYVLAHFDHQSRLFRVELFDTNGRSWHRAYNEDYMPRNSTATGFFSFPIDGVTFAGNSTYTLPDGTYYAKISVLKALGDSSNLAHWETWNSPMFVIDRP
jgi:minor extracellular serine protease Vpr